MILLDWQSLIGLSRTIRATRNIALLNIYNPKDQLKQDFFIKWNFTIYLRGNNRSDMSVFRSVTS